MWTDSETYLTWGRELFGWPLQLADLQLDGPLWRGDGDTGTATVRTPDVTVSATVHGAAAGSPPPATPAVWLTPKRVLDLSSDGRSRIDVTAVAPTVIEPGVRTAVRASVSLTTDERHPLHRLRIVPSHGELHRGFAILVGADVSIAASWPATPQ
jgi:hypothetical protein